MYPTTTDHLLPTDDASSLVIIPPGHTARIVTQTRLLHTDRVVQEVHCEDVGALEVYLTKLVTNPAALVIYIDTKSRKVTAILDHASDAELPGTNQHLVHLQLEYSPDFASLSKVLGKPMPQADFLAFLDENAHIFVECAALKEVCANFSSINITRVKSVRNERNGAHKLVVDTTEEQDASVSLPPAEITTKVAIFPGQPQQELAVHCRYRPAGGAVNFLLIVPGLEALIRKEVGEIQNRLQFYCAERGKDEEASAWNQVPLIRADLTKNKLTTPLPEKSETIQGLPMPETLRIEQPAA
jgi:hypothetical protein